MKNMFLLALLLMGISLKATEVNCVSKDEPDIIVEAMYQKVEFFLEDELLKARVSVDLKVIGTKAIASMFRKAIFIDNTSEVENYKAKTGKKKVWKRGIAFDDYASSGIFHSDLKVGMIEFPLKKESEALNIHFEKVYHDIKFLEPLYFNDMYEVKYSELEVIVPEWLTADIVEWNFENEPPKKEINDSKGGKSYAYFQYDVTPVNEYGGQPRRNKIDPHLIILCKTYKTKKLTKTGLRDVGDLYEWYSSLVKEVQDKPETLQAKVDELTSGKSTDKEKIESIFYWVQDNIRYIAFEYGISGFRPEECQAVFNNKYGDCKGMANLTKQMLVLAGYDARLTWIGTTDLPYTYDIPSLIVDNHMICTVVLDGKYVYLDATEKYADIYEYAPRIRGKQVLIEDGENYIIDEVPSDALRGDSEMVTHAFTIEDDIRLVGSGSISFTGNNKSMMMYRLSTIPEKEWNDALVRYVGNSDKNVKIKLHTVPDLEERSEEFKLGYDVTVENQLTNIGTEIYFSPEIDHQLASLDMPEDRDVAYEFGNLYDIQYNIEVTVPDGWEVSYLPTPILLETDKYEVKLEYSSTTGKISYAKKIKLKNRMMEVSEFPSWNEAISQIKEFYEDQIILKKK